MYSVSLTNNYFSFVSLDFIWDGHSGYSPGAVISSNSNGKWDRWGNHILNVNGMGPITCIDLGSKRLSGFTHEEIPWMKHHWGGLIRYRGLDAYFRYEGGGHVEMVLDEHGCLHCQFPQGGMLISLRDLQVKSK